jgi:bifunctional DNA-binding transcriptional regulator/antitoxin component of YhaV-PrlF toxin-antitoxin module
LTKIGVIAKNVQCSNIAIIVILRNLTLKAEVKIVTITSQETDVEIQQFPIVLGEGGEITIPQLLQDSLNVNEGDMLVLLQIGNLIVLAPKQPQAPQLIDRIATIMENENVELTDLLAGLEAEREAIWREQKS